MHPHPLTRRAAVATLLAGAASAATASAPAAPLHDHGAAPEFAGIEQWLQSPPLTMAGLRGRVVLIDFWTFGCINCIRTLPHVNKWHAEYAAQGLTVIGVHTPEFAFERPTPSVQAAMQKLGVKHAVAQDNRYATWKAWQNRYWPAHYLVDAQGRVQYRHYGEGDYDRTEAAIRALLARRRTTA